MLQQGYNKVQDFVQL